MKLRINFIIDDEERARIADIKDMWIRTDADLERVEKAIKKKYNAKEVKVINWKIFGGMTAKLGRKRNDEGKSR